MTNRCLASLGAAVIAMTVAWLSAADLAAQVAAGTAAPSAQATSGTSRPPRTPGGQPDLQGYWTSLSFTPLERPEKYGTREFLTDDELKEVFKAGVDHAEQAHHVDRGSVNCRLPPLTPQAMARPRGRQEPVFDSPEDLGVGVRCLTFGGPPIPTGSGYNRNVFIVQGRDHVVVEYEWGSTPANSNAATVRMTERFTRIDENTIEYNYTIDDPSTWTGHGLRSFR